MDFDLTQEQEDFRKAVRAFADAQFPNLIELWLTESDLNDDAAEVLANIPSLETLRSFNLGNNRIGGRGATALLASPHLTNLAFLSLETDTPDVAFSLPLHEPPLSAALDDDRLYLGQNASMTVVSPPCAPP